jgi:hypothetical protein
VLDESSIVAGRSEELHGVATGILEQDLLVTDAGDDVLSEPCTVLARGLDEPRGRRPRERGVREVDAPLPPGETRCMATVGVRCIVDDVDDAISF